MIQTIIDPKKKKRVSKFVKCKYVLRLRRNNIVYNIDPTYTKASLTSKAALRI